jgi:hypothetical protein
MTNEVGLRLKSCREKLSKLPKAITEDYTTATVRLITEVSTKLQSCVRGGPDEPQFVQSNRATYHSLKISVRRTAPRFSPTTSESAALMVEDYEDEDEERIDYDPSEKGVMNLTDMRKHISK